jgi:2-polyprenyl-6-methoxyphenol hydroxylase-like FAD-dependent oxidoreductase
MDMQVLVVGAGPTGLNLAIWLAKSGVRCRIIDKHAGPGDASRAMAVQARTLEFYRQLGFDQRVLESGIPMKSFRLREGSRELATVRLDEAGSQSRSSRTASRSRFTCPHGPTHVRPRDWSAMRSTSYGRTVMSRSQGIPER